MDMLVRLRRDIVACTRCRDLRAYCADIARRGKREFAGQSYWGKPVPPLGEASAAVLIIGLAPAAHGGNRTGRMFTGDGSADWLARALFASGFATQPHSIKRGDGYALSDAFMTAAIRCAPPGNKPTPRQIANCAVHLRAELDTLRDVRVVVPLGKIAFDIITRHLRERGYASSSRPLRFGHALEYKLEHENARPLMLVCSC